VERNTRVWLVAAVLAAVSCAGGGPGERSRAATQEKPFPTRDELRKLGATPPPEQPAASVVRADAWDLAGPFPERIGEEPISDPNAWEQLLVEAASQRAGLVVASQAMRCAAREFGRFQLERGGAPDQSLHRFLLARCGATGMRADAATLQGDLALGSTDAAVLQQWREQARGMIEEHLGTGARAVGIWFGRRGDHAFLMLLSAERRVRIDPASPLAGADGRIELRGEALTAAQTIEGFVNQGRSRVAQCERDESLRPPRFALRCPTEKGDESAWIEAVVFPPGRVLGEIVLDVLSRPGGAQVTSYRRPRYGRSAPIASGEEFSKRLLVELNRVREQADAPPLVFESKESEDAEKLAAPYFGAYLGTSDPSLGDVAALGLMAGWDVDGTIREAGVGGALVAGTSDLEAWLAEALERPSVRSTLLDPKRSRLAVGPLVSPKDAYLAALVATYSVYGADDPAAQLAAFHAHLDREYAARSLPAPVRDADIAALVARYVGLVQSGSRTPEAALRDLLAEVSARLHAQVQGWRLEGSSPEDVAFPDQLFAKDVRRIAAAVGYYQPPGSAWGRTLVFVVVLPEGSLRSVEREPRAELGSS